MKNQSDIQTNKLFILIILLAIWSMAGVFLLTNYTPYISLLGITLNIFILIFSLTQLFPYSSWVSLIISTLLFIASGYSLLNNTQEFLIYSGIGLGTFIITTILCVFLTKEVQETEDKYLRLQQVIDSLLIYDQNTSLMRYQFAKQALSTEILRGRRYENDVSLVLFEILNKDQYPQEEIRRIHRIMAEIIQNSIRTDIDIGFINDVIGLILPETGSSGANVLTSRLIKRFARKVDAHIKAGIACFPEDAITVDEVMERSKDALRIALNSDRNLIAYQELQREEEAENQEKESTQPVNLEDKSSSRQDYVTILENINLFDNEWIVWIEGFNQMSDLIHVEKSLLSSEHVDNLEFLFLQDNHLVVKISSTSENLNEEALPFPDWQVKKTNLANHYLLIAKNEGPE